GQGHGARAAECVARPIAAAVPPALPERDRRRAARVAATAVTGYDLEMKRRTVKRYLLAAPALVLLGAAGCKKAESVRPYTTIPVARRDIIVTATASGVIQPILTLSVKSKASGEIIALPVQTGEEVKKGQLLAKIDQRIAQNNLAQAQARLDVARRQLENAPAPGKRGGEPHARKPV